MPMHGPLLTGRQYLTEVQYADDRHLAARQAIYAHQESPFNLYSWALDFVSLRGQERVVDVGCGNGRYLTELRNRHHSGLLIGLDLSTGMLASVEAHATQISLVQADAERIPLASSAADVALSMHMLYHVPDRESAIAELRRIVRAGGTALVVTNGADHLRQLDELLAAAVSDVIGTQPRRGSPLRAFRVDCAEEECARAFGEVTVHRLERALKIPGPAPVVAYALSMTAFLMSDPDPDPATTTATAMDEIIRRIDERVREAVESEGVFRVSTSVGCLVCR